MALKLDFRSPAVWLVALCPIVSAALVLIAPAMMERQEMVVFDLYQSMVEPEPVPEKFVVVLARERSLRELQNWPWPRRHHAQLLERMRLAKLWFWTSCSPRTPTPRTTAFWPRGWRPPETS